MSYNMVMAIIWLIWAVIIFYRKGDHPMFHTALICSAIWAATA